MRTATGDTGHRWTQEEGHARIYSGHESFPCRYGWLPKLYEAVADDPELFSDDERAIMGLGLGKNMVKALRFWGQAFGLLEVTRGTARNTGFAQRMLDPETGRDPYLEEMGSLWRLHWVVTAHAGLGAWVATFLELQDTQIARERLIDLVRSRARAAKKSIALGTAKAHVDMLLRTYDWTHFDQATPGEDISGCPFRELHLLETSLVNGETYVTLKRGAKLQLDTEAFAFALYDYWQGTAPGSRSLSLRSLLLDRRSPGVIFCLDEPALHACLEDISRVAGLQLRSDGVGGIDLVCGAPEARERLKEFAWQCN